MLEAEGLIAAGEYADAEAILTALPTEPGSYSRDLLRKVLEERQAWERLGAALDPPATIAELSAAVRALVESSQFERAEALLDEHGSALSTAEPDLAELRRFIDARRTIS